MTIFFNSDKRRFTSAGWWFFLPAIALLSVFLFSISASAQPKSTDINLWLHGAQNNYSLDVKAGQDNRLYLDVRNYGADAIHNIHLFVEAPKGWSVVIVPSEIGALSAGNVTTLEVHLNPAGGITTTGQQVTFSVQSDETAEQKFPFFITVKPAQTLIWVWVALGVVVIGVFIFIYLKFGRQ